MSVIKDLELREQVPNLDGHGPLSSHANDATEKETCALSYDGVFQV